MDVNSLAHTKWDCKYHILLTKNDTYAEINTELRREMKEIRENVQIDVTEPLTDKWKQQYRRSHI